jgi:glycosyltransferase involved in cell wall biosynthesis
VRYLVYSATFPSSTANDPRQTGIGRYCGDLAQGLAADRHDVDILEADPRGSTAREVARLIARIARFRPDYLLVGDTYTQRLTAFAGHLITRSYCPVFYGTEVHSLHRRLRYEGRSIRKRLHKTAFSAYLRRAHIVIAISRYTAALVNEATAGVVDSFVLHPCVSSIFLSTQRRPAPALQADPVVATSKRPLTFITVGRISERKNQLGVLRALHALKQTRSLPFRYLIVGNVDSPDHQPYFTEIQRYIAEAGLAECVSLITNASDEEKVDHIDSSDIFIMLSQQAGLSVEGFGISVIEASCRERPVIVSSHGGMPETLIQGKTGFCVDVQDESNVTAAIMTLATDEYLRVSMGRIGRDHVHANFTPVAMARRLSVRLGTEAGGEHLGWSRKTSRDGREHDGRIR